MRKGERERKKRGSEEAMTMKRQNNKKEIPKTGPLNPPPQLLAASEGASGRPEGGESAVGPAGAVEAAHTLPQPCSGAPRPPPPHPVPTTLLQPVGGRMTVLFINKYSKFYGAD